MASNSLYCFSVKRGIVILSIVAGVYTAVLASLDILIAVSSNQNVRQAATTVVASDDWQTYDFILKTFRLSRAQTVAMIMSSAYLVFFPFLAVSGVIGTQFRRRGIVSGFLKVLWGYLALSVIVGVIMIAVVSKNTFAQDCTRRTSKEQDCKAAARFFVDLCVGASVCIWLLFFGYCILVRGYFMELEEEHAFRLRSAKLNITGKESSSSPPLREGNQEEPQSSIARTVEGLHA